MKGGKIQNEIFIMVFHTVQCQWRLCLYSDKWRDIWWNIAWAQEKSRGLRLYFSLYPDSSHNIDILNYISSIDLPGDQYWKS